MSEAPIRQRDRSETLETNSQRLFGRLRTKYLHYEYYLTKEQLQTLQAWEDTHELSDCEFKGTIYRRPEPLK